MLTELRRGLDAVVQSTRDLIKAETSRPYWATVNRTILLVDDNKTDVDLVKRSLSSGPEAPRLVVASDGDEALRILREAPRDSSRPALILLDLNLPRKNGHQVLAEIKEDPALKHIPVVVLTSSNAERDILGAYDLH